MYLPALFASYEKTLPDICNTDVCIQIKVFHSEYSLGFNRVSRSRGVFSVVMI